MSLEKCVHRIFLGGLDKTAGIYYSDISRSWVVNKCPTICSETPSKLFGIDIIAGTAQSYESNSCGL